MKVFKFIKADAFACGAASGNPAGCIFLKNDTDIDGAGMQQIARELKGFVSEAAFLFPVEDGFRLKFYSSECEVEFCGHGSIATMYELIRENEDLMKKQEITLYVNAGRLSVFNHIPDEDAVYIMAPEPQFFQCVPKLTSVAQALSLNEEGIDKDVPMQIINAGLRTLIVPITSLAACLDLYPKQEVLRQFCIDNDIDIVLVFCKETYLSSSHYRTRVFAPKFGYLEDPATGSGNSAFGYYLIQKNLWTKNITIEQGMSKENPNIVKLRRYQNGQNDRILFGGSALVRISGEYFLHQGLGEIS
jgi:PhzF family phenazine biosynthesis protein